MTVHIAINGRALCGRGDLDFHGEWVGAGEAEAATCDECRKNAAEVLAGTSVSGRIVREPLAERLANELAALRKSIVDLRADVKNLVEIVGSQPRR